MENFTNFCQKQKHNKALEIQTTTSANIKTGFVASRLNRDNFWNLMFFAGTSLGFTISILIGFIPLAPIFAIATGWVVKHNSHITFDKEYKDFTTSRGIKLKKNAGEFFLLALTSVFSSMVLCGLLYPGYRIADLTIVSGLLFSLTTLFISMYCILRNFPLAAFFYKAAWKSNETEFSKYEGYKKHHASNYNSISASRHITNRTHWRDDSAYRSSTGNIYNRRQQ